MSFYGVSIIFLCNIPQAKSGMDYFSEISNITVTGSDLDHLEAGEEDEEETEPADEVDEDMGGEDRTAGKQTSAIRHDLQQKAKLTPAIVHVKHGE